MLKVTEMKTQATDSTDNDLARRRCQTLCEARVEVEGRISVSALLIQLNGRGRGKVLRMEKKLLSLAVRRSVVTLEQFLSNGGGRSQDR